MSRHDEMVAAHKLRKKASAAIDADFDVWFELCKTLEPPEEAKFWMNLAYHAGRNHKPKEA